MNTTYTYITVDGDGNDPRAKTVEASGIGEAGQIAYGEAENEDRFCIAVAEAKFEQDTIETLMQKNGIEAWIA